MNHNSFIINRFVEFALVTCQTELILSGYAGKPNRVLSKEERDVALGGVLSAAKVDEDGIRKYILGKRNLSLKMVIRGVLLGGQSLDDIDCGKQELILGMALKKTVEAYYAEISQDDITEMQPIEMQWLELMTADAKLRKRVLDGSINVSDYGTLRFHPLKAREASLEVKLAHDKWYASWILVNSIVSAWFGERLVWTIG